MPALSGLLGKSSSFSRRAEPLLGVDIGSTSIKVMELAASGSGFRIERFAVEPLPKGSMDGRNIVDMAAVGTAIGRAKKKAGFHGKGAVAAIPGSGTSVITKVMPMQVDLNEDEMESQVELEAAQSISMPIQEVSMDFSVLGPTAGAIDSVDVLMVATRTEEVDNLVEALETGGLTAKIIDVEMLAMENAFSLLPLDPLPEGGLTALLDIGSAITTLSVIRNIHTIYSRDGGFGGKQLLDGVVERYNMPPAEALQHILQGGLPDSYVKDVLEPFQASAGQQVEHLLQMFYASNEANHVDRVVLAGGGALTEGLPEALSKRLGVECLVANPLQGMKVPSSLDIKTLRGGPSVMVVAGLALRAFD